MNITKQIKAIEDQLRTSVVNKNVDFYNPISWIQKNPKQALNIVTVVTNFSGAVRKWFKYVNTYSVTMFIDTSIASSDDVHNIIEKIVDSMKPMNLTVSDKIIENKYIAIIFGLVF